MKKGLRLFLFFLLIDSIVYWGLWNTFFQQDEWFLFGRIIYQLQNLPLSLFDFASTHFWPLANIVWIIQYKIFYLNYSLYAIHSLLIHSITVTVLYYFFKHLLKNGKVAFMLSFLFLVSFPARQTVVWFAVSYTLPYATILLLLALIYLINLKNRVLNTKDIIIFLIAFFVGISFREEATLLILLIPSYILLFWGMRGLKDNKRQLFFLIFVMAGFTALRFLMQSYFGEHIQFEKDKNWIMTVYNIATVPYKMTIQNIIEYNQIVFLAQKYARLAYPRILNDGLTIVTLVFENVTLLLFIPLALLSGIAFAKLDSKHRRNMIFGFLIVFFYSMLISPQTRRLISLDSRYLFIGNIGVLIILYEIYKGFLKFNSAIFKKIVKTISVAFIIIFSAYSYLNIREVMAQNYIPTSMQRTSIITQITALHPNINRDTVFYIDCRREEDCKINPLVMPFQSGVGQMLMVIYGSQDERGYAPFFKGFYLWDWEAEDYLKIGEYGFGYFRHFEKLKKQVQKGNFTADTVIGLSYDRSENKIYDVTKNTRKLLKEGVQ